MTGYLHVSTAAESEEVANHLARSAVERRLAAGAQVSGPIRAFFWHAGVSGTGEEWKVTLKTTTARYPELEAHLLAEHSWENPELVAIPIAHAPEGYLAWLDRSVRPE